MNANRLLKLADHLESKNRGHKRFDFSEITNGQFKCGTVGCAIGEIPIVFPRLARFGDNAVVSGSGENFTSGFGVAAKIFGIDRADATYLFAPTAYDGWESHDPSYYGDVKKVCERLGIKPLKANATARQVAKNIRLFVEKNKSTKRYRAA